MKAVCIVPVTEQDKALIKAAAPGCEVLYGTEESLRGEICDADIIFGNPDSSLLRECHHLKWIQTASAGVDPYIKNNPLPEGCLLTNATGGYGLAISEHMLGMYLSLIKKLHLYRDNQTSSQWKDLGPVTSVHGSTVLILGMGDIGTEFAKLCKAMGAYVIGLRRKDKTPSPYADEIHLTEDLNALLPLADAVAIALPGTKDTYKLIDRKRISSMKDGAVLLNVGRGTVVDTEALCDALESGKLSGAGLDVTDPEPLPSSHRLWKIPTAIITPHVSGGYHLEETRVRIVKIFAENLSAFLEGRKLKNLVDFETGYRSL